MSELFKQALKQVLISKTTISVGKVKEFNGITCTVERENLPPLLDVRLQALEGNFDNNFLIVPKVGSEVICLALDGESEETCIVQYTEIESVKISIGGAVLKVENGKFQVKNDVADLKNLLTELLTELKMGVITTPSGPGNFAPYHQEKFEELKTKVTQLLE